MLHSSIRFAFFGSSHFSVIVLDELERAGFLPACVITTPDKPQGRKLIITPNPVKTWALEKKIPVYDPAKLDDELISNLKQESCDLFVVASYGKIIPAAIIDIPPHKTLNIHPSLLPIYRGASPLQSAILNDTTITGVTIMRIDEKMDHGPILAQKTIIVDTWPTYEVFETMMATEGAGLLASIMPDWVHGKIAEIEQDHTKATYTKKISKEDALIDLSADPYLNFRKIQAYHEWPQAFFFITHHDKQLRIKITSASFKDGVLTIEKVIPEGSKEISYKDFVDGYTSK